MRFPFPASPALILFTLLLPAALPATAKQNDSGVRSAVEPTLALTKEQWNRFPDALTALSRSGKVTFVAEGVPLAPALPEASAPDQAIPLSELVAKVAEAYDYDVERQGNIFLLKKRYRNPADLPGVNLEEYREFLRDSIRLVQPLSVSDNESPRLIRTLLASFSFAQWQQLDSKEGLSLRSLTPVQRTQHERLLLTSYLGFPLALARQDLALIDKAPQTTFLRKPWERERGKVEEALGYEQPKERFLPVRLVKGSPVRDANPARRASKPAAWHETLQHVVTRLNARVGAERFAVDPVLADRPVRLIGENQADATQVFTALARLFDLRRVEGEGRQRLVRRTVRPTRNVADLPLVMRQALPEPLRRAALQGKALEATPDGASRFQANLEAMSVEAVQRLTEEVELLLARHEGWVPFSALSPKARSAFAFCRVMGYLGFRPGPLSPELPPYVAAYGNKFNDLRLWRHENTLTLGLTDGPMQLISRGLPEEYEVRKEKETKAQP